MKYVGIYVALYDYQAQNEKELSFKADNVLYITNNEDPDWFKAQLKVPGDEEGPLGLVPSNYIEKAKPIGTIKALYNYESRSAVELSIKEDEILTLYEKDDPNWFIAENSTAQIGLVPSNYVEFTTASQPQQTKPILASCEPKWAVAIYSFEPQGQTETYLQENEPILVIDYVNNKDWWKIEHKDGTSGIVPATYLKFQEQDHGKQAEKDKALEELNRLKELEEKERERKAEAERRRKMQEEAKQKELELKKQASLAAVAAAASPQLGSPHRNQIPAPPPPTNYQPQHSPVSIPAPAPVATPQQTQPEADPNNHSNYKLRTWTDRTGAFKVEAQFLSCANGKIRLHKSNGVKIDVPLDKMCVEDLRYIETETGVKLFEDKNDNVPLAHLQQKQQLSKGDFNWLDYFKKINLPQNVCVQYAGTFEVNKLTEQDIEKLTFRQMKMLGMAENDIYRLQRFIETGIVEPPAEHKQVPRSALKTSKSTYKKKVTFGGVSYIEDEAYDEDEDLNESQMSQDERLARELQQSEYTNHVGLQRRGTGRPTPNHSAPQNVNFAVLTPQQFQPPSAVHTTPTPPPPVHVAQTPIQPVTPVNNSSQLKTGFDDNAWAPRALSNSPSANTWNAPNATTSSVQNTRSIATPPILPAGSVPQLPARQRPTAQTSQHNMVDPSLLAKWSGSPSLASANSRPVPPIPQQQTNPLQQMNPVQHTGNVSLQHTGSISLQHTGGIPLQHTGSVSLNQSSLQHQNSFSLQSQTGFTSLAVPNQLFQPQSSPLLSQNTFQPSSVTGFQGHLTPSSSATTSNTTATTNFGYPVQSVLPAPLVPQATANSNFSVSPQLIQSQLQPQMTGRSWASATPSNPFGTNNSPMLQQQGLQQQGFQPQGFQQQAIQPQGYLINPQQTGYGTLPNQYNNDNTFSNQAHTDSNDKYAIFRNLNSTSTTSVFNTNNYQ